MATIQQTKLQDMLSEKVRVLMVYQVVAEVCMVDIREERVNGYITNYAE
jgi:hypothetical protein